MSATAAAIPETFHPKRPQVTNDQSLQHETGLLHPDGRFYPCHCEGHGDTYYSICEQGDYPVKPGRYYDQEGFMRVGYGTWSNHGITPTQAQLDFIFDWVAVNPSERSFPAWLAKKLGMSEDAK